MAQNLQLQTFPRMKTKRIRHRGRLVPGPRLSSRQPGLSNFLAAVAARLNSDVGISGVTSQEVLDSIDGVGFGVLNRNTGDTFSINVGAQYFYRPLAVADANNAGIPIA